VALANGRLKMSPHLELAETLREELRNFKIKVNINTGHDYYEKGRSMDAPALSLFHPCKYNVANKDAGCG
jgi:hypothetical protein